MDGFNSNMANNLITLKELFDIYNFYCPNKGEVSFETFVSEFMRINPTYRLG